MRTDLYCKPTYSGRYLNYFSSHPISHKKGVVVGFVDRIFNLSHPCHHQKNFEIAIQILLNNSYPLHFIFNNFYTRILQLLNKNNQKIDNESENNFFVVPYIPSISIKIAKIIKSFDLKIAYSITHSLSEFVKVTKDHIEMFKRCNVVYKINCINCNCSYVGQTKRRLISRINEHQKDINKKSSVLSVISEHRLNEGHDFNWSEVKILDNESWYQKRMTSEMLYIKRQTNGLNRQTDTDSLPVIYNNLIECLTKV